MADEDRSAKPVPTALALLAFLPLGVLLWWAVAGPRPEPARIDWRQLGYRTEQGPSGALAEVGVDEAPDAVLRTKDLAGQQRPLLGPLDGGSAHGDGTFVALVRTPVGDSRVTEAPGIAGVVLTGGGGSATRCAFDEPVPTSRFDRAAERLGADADGNARAVTREATGRCGDDGPRVAVPLVHRVVVPQDLLQRVAGQRPEAALLPAGVALAGPDGRVEVVPAWPPGDGADAGEASMPVYAREIARQALVRAAPSNPNVDLGALGDPAYPVLGREGDALWWVMPVSPAEDETLAGFARTRADRVEVGMLNAVEILWLDDPVPGPATLERRARDLLREEGELSGDALEQVRLRWSVPDREGRWQGHVTHAGEVHYTLVADGTGEVCVDDLDGHRIGCRGGGS